MTITEFLLSHIAEDEAVAREAIAMREAVHYADPKTATRPDYDFQAWPDIGVPAVIVGPERVLRECEAKRQVIGRHKPEAFFDAPDDSFCGHCQEGGNRGLFPCPDLRTLATIYSDHPDFDPEWRRA
jgi:hypothetical protein